MKSRIKPPLFLVGIFVFILLWQFRPWIHDFLMFFNRHPLSIVIPVVIIMVLIGMWRAKIAVKYILIAAVVIFNLGGILIGLETELSYRAIARSIQYEKRTTFPDVAQLRLLPKSTSTRYAVDTLQNPQDRLGDSQIVIVDGKLQRVFPRLPDGPWLYFFRKMSGIVTIDQSILGRSAQIDDQTFELSEGVGVFDNIYFQLIKKKYFVEYVDPIYLKDPETEQWVTVVPYIRYTSFPFRVPTWGGFMVVTSDGTITDHAPEDAEKLALTKGNRVYPKELSRLYAESYAYKGGLINKWFIHKDQPQIDDLADAPQPYHIPTKEGYKQVIVARPTGASYGVYKLFLFDATTGKREIIEYDQNSQLTGPAAAVDYVKRAFPTIDYSTFTITEPRPIAVSGKLYWLLSVADVNGAGVAHTVLVDALTTNVISFTTETDIEKFVRTGQVSETAVSPTTPAQPSTQSTAEIQQKVEAIQKQLEELKQSLQKLETN